MRLTLGLTLLATASAIEMAPDFEERQMNYEKYFACIRTHRSVEDCHDEFLRLEIRSTEAPEPDPMSINVV